MQFALKPGETAKKLLKKITQNMTREEKRRRADVAWLVKLIKR